MLLAREDLSMTEARNVNGWGQRPDNSRRPANASRVLRRSGDSRAPTKRTGGTAASDISVWLTASEIGSYAFCPQAWYLDRQHVPVTVAADARRETGRTTHQVIGQETDFLRVTEAGRRLLVIIILAALLLLVGFLLRGAG